MCQQKRSPLIFQIWSSVTALNHFGCASYFNLLNYIHEKKVHITYKSNILIVNVKNISCHDLLIIFLQYSLNTINNTILIINYTFYY